MNNTSIQLNDDLLKDYVQSLSIEIVSKMIDLYREQVIIYLADIESSLESNDDVLWQQYCHKMKGAAGSIGLQSLHAQLAFMERTSADITEKAQQLVELKLHNQQALAKVDAWLELNS